jgi:N-acetylated-alpha-linked acidic dipeptidase
MKTRLLLAAAASALLSASAASCEDKAGAPASPPLLGFDATGAAAQRALEARFDAAISRESIRDNLRRMSAAPNQVGAPHNRANAEYVRDLFRSWGWDARIETFEVLYPTPVSEALELVGPEPFRASLTEPAIPGVPSSQQTANVLPAYVAYQGDGDVTAELVYVNYGMPADYEALERMGVDVRGKIAIARYGGGWRGLKPKLAQEHGAVGCIIYSDPADDGYAAGDTYPKGAWRPPAGFQRGSVADMPVYPGDPTTPGYGSTPGTKRLSREQAKTILKIPVLPIGYGDAQRFLAALDGQTVPKSWRGALPITYKAGPGPAKVHMSVKSDWSLKTLYDVIAVMPGRSAPDQWVIRGNHRDAWVLGANDPLSGHVAMLEEAKAIGALARTGWRPERTIVYASWDGEEPGLLGSTEWAETHADELKRKAVLYLNTDSNGRGVLDAGASYSAQRLIDQAARDVRDPETGVSVAERRRAWLQVKAVSPGASDEDRKRAKAVAAGGDLPVGPLGSGSDYTPFVQHLGVASINLGYGEEDEQDGVYHSLYDDFEHFVRFGDPDMAYGAALAQTAGRIVLRTADAPLLPYRFGGLADNVGDHAAELKRLADSRREQAETVGRLLDSGAYRLAADPTLPFGPPDRPAKAEKLDFSGLDAAVARLKTSARAYDEAAARAGGGDTRRRARADAILRTVEQSLTDEQGLPGRDWFKHVVYAPGLLTGYGAKTLPGVREAIEGGRWAEAQTWLGRTATALDAAARRIDEATAALGGG